MRYHPRMAIPKTKPSDLLDRLNLMMVAEHLDELELRRIKNEATSLKDVPDVAYQAYGVLGALAAFTCDYAAIKSNFEAALRICPSDTVSTIRFNYVNALTRGCCNTAAAREAMDAHRSYPDDPSVTELAMRTALVAGHLTDLIYLIERYEALGREVKVYDKGMADLEISDIQDRMNALGYSEKDLWARLEVAETVVRESGVEVIGVSVAVMPDGSFRYSFGCHTDVKTAVDVSFAIADALVDSFDDTLMDLVTFSAFSSKREIKSPNILT